MLGKVTAGEASAARGLAWKIALPGFVIPVLLVFLALVLRVAGIGAQELWLDEAASWRAVTAPDMLAGLLPDNTPPLYYLLLQRWVAVFGDGRTALRLLSALEGTLFVVAVMFWARILFTRRVALWSGLWAAVAPMAIYYSQEGRAYAQLTLLLALTYACVSKAAARNHNGWWLAAVAAAPRRGHRGMPRRRCSPADRLEAAALLRCGSKRSREARRRVARGTDRGRRCGGLYRAAGSTGDL